MKKVLLSFLMFIALAGCKERNEDLINLLPENNIPGEILVIDTSYTVSNAPAQTQKNVLIEDFTGVKCINCPRASGIAQEIVKNNPGRVSVLGIHPTSMDQLTKPYSPGSKYDFRTAEGTNLMNSLGSPIGLPTGSINRIKFTGESSILIGDDKWVSKTSAQLNEKAVADITFTSIEYNPADRSLKVAINVIYTQASADANYLSLAFSEDDLVDLQKTPTHVDSNYVHNHVLRKFAQPATGLQLTGDIEKGSTFEIKYNTVIPEGWNPEKCHLVAILHKKTAPDFEVLQVIEDKVKK